MRLARGLVSGAEVAGPSATAQPPRRSTVASSSRSGRWPLNGWEPTTAGAGSASTSPPSPASKSRWSRTPS